MADHPVPGPEREAVRVPAAGEGLSRLWLVKTAMPADGFHRCRQLGHGGDVASQHASRRQSTGGSTDTIPGRQHVEHHPVEG